MANLRFSGGLELGAGIVQISSFDSYLIVYSEAPAVLNMKQGGVVDLKMRLEELKLPNVSQSAEERLS